MSRAFKERQKRNLLDRIDRLTEASNELKYEETTASESSDGRTATVHVDISFIAHLNGSTIKDVTPARPPELVEDNPPDPKESIWAWVCRKCSTINNEYMPTCTLCKERRPAYPAGLPALTQTIVEVDDVEIKT